MATKKRFAPYVINRLATQSAAATTEWRRQNAKCVETEILKPESFLPVTTGTSGRSPICFTIKSVPHSRVDGANIFVETQFVIEKYEKTTKKWTPTDGEDLVIPIANTAQSLFEDLNVSINGVLAENTQRDYTIKAYLQNLLFSTPSDRATWMESGLLALDGAGAFRQIKAMSDAGWANNHPGNSSRKRTTDGTKTSKVYSRLLSDVLACNEPLPDNVNINIKLFPAKSEACLVQTVPKSTKDEDIPQYRVTISDCTLYVPRITLITNKPNVDHVLSFTNWKTLAYTHKSSQTMFKTAIAIGETLPQKAMVVFMTEEAYNGSWETNKVEFKSCRVSSVVMKCNQRHVPFMNGYQCDWENDLYHPAYVGLTTELGAVGHPILYDGFDEGYAIFGFDLTPNKTGNVALEQPNRGALELDVEFKPAPNANLMVIVVLIYADRFVITKDGSFSNIT